MNMDEFEMALNRALALRDDSRCDEARAAVLALHAAVLKERDESRAMWREMVADNERLCALVFKRPAPVGKETLVGLLFKCQTGEASCRYTAERIMELYARPAEPPAEMREAFEKWYEQPPYDPMEVVGRQNHCWLAFQAGAALASRPTSEPVCPKCNGTRKLYGAQPGPGPGYRTIDCPDCASRPTGEHS